LSRQSRLAALAFLIAGLVLSLYPSAEAAVVAQQRADHVFSVQRRAGSHSVPIFLPREAKKNSEGRGPFFLMKLGVEVVLSARSGPGVLYVSGSVNGCTPIQIRVSIPKGSGVDTASWAAFGVNGAEGGTLTHGALKVKVSQYLPTCSLNPGEGTLTWSFERFGGLRVRSLAVLAGSDVETTRVAPPKLVLKPLYPVEYPEKGEGFPIEFRVENVGDVAARGVAAEIVPRSSALVAARPHIVHLGTVGKEARGEFTLTGRKVGKYLADLRVGSSNANHPDALVAVPVRRPSAGGGTSWWPLLAAAALIGFLFFGWRRYRGS